MKNEAIAVEVEEIRFTLDGFLETYRLNQIVEDEPWGTVKHIRVDFNGVANSALVTFDSGYQVEISVVEMIIYKPKHKKRK